MTGPKFSLCAIILSLALLARGESLRPWDDYQVIMWIGDTAYKQPEKIPLFFQRLREMGVTTGMVHGEAEAQPLLDANLPYYVENMVNRGLCLKWNSKVADWDKYVTAWKDERSEDGLVREYSFDDLEWQRWGREKVQSLAKRHAPNGPLAYNLRDELSVTMSANPFDYDFSPTALNGFREWLKTQYGSLDQLNKKWNTEFRAWDEVKPFTTDQIKNRMSGGVGSGNNGAGLPRGKPDWQMLQKVEFVPTSARENPAAWNFAPWCDHRTYMDLSLARTLSRLRDDIRVVDSRTPVGIEGTQMPAAFGGYDLWRLSQVLDWVEPYDIGNAREIFGSFMPGKPLLTTVGEKDVKAAQRRLWHLLLEGDRGCIIWWSEDCIDWNDPEYALTPRAKALTPILQEMRSPLARIFLRAEREIDPIAIHYSQPSIQVDWLLESTVDGSTWLRRFSSYEAEHNRMTQRRQAWVKLLQDCGYAPQFVSSDQIAQGGLKGMKALVLCNSLALSDAEAKAIKEFSAAQEGARMLMGNGNVACFDEHGTLRSQLPDILSAKVAHRSEDHTWAEIVEGGRSIPQTGSGELGKWLKTRGGKVSPADLLPIATLERVIPRIVQVPPELAVRTHRFRAGSARLLAFERNVVWQMGDDLKQHGGNAELEKPVSFEAKLSAPAHVYDLRQRKYLGHIQAIPVDLDPWHPSLFALLEQKLEEGKDIEAALSER